jgi:hypothetical protein
MPLPEMAPSKAVLQGKPKLPDKITDPTFKPGMFDIPSEVGLKPLDPS